MKLLKSGTVGLLARPPFAYYLALNFILYPDYNPKGERRPHILCQGSPSFVCPFFFDETVSLWWLGLIPISTGCWPANRWSCLRGLLDYIHKWEALPRCGWHHLMSWGVGRKKDRELNLCPSCLTSWLWMQGDQLLPFLPLWPLRHDGHEIHSLSLSGFCWVFGCRNKTSKEYRLATQSRLSSISLRSSG